jgi:hypothetical protein
MRMRSQKLMTHRSTCMPPDADAEPEADDLPRGKLLRLGVMMVGASRLELLTPSL